MVETALRAIEIGEFDRRLAALERQVADGQIEDGPMADGRTEADDAPPA